MEISIANTCIPGTILKRSQMGDVTGLEFLKKIFYISDGIMLSEIREISGIDGSTLQNWTKRGWVANATLKKYNIDQLAHILIINMLRSCLQLDKIAFIIRYINGSVEDRSDDIISDSSLYDYICRILDKMVENDDSNLMECIDSVTKNYVEKVGGARRRLNNALEIILTAYYASLIKQSAEEKLTALQSC